MPDLYDYVLSGVMPGHWVTPHLPDDFERELEEGALDYADSVVLAHRRTDRLFDALCADGSAQWTPLHLPFSEVRIGSRVILPPTRLRTWTIDGQVTGFEERYGRTEVTTTTHRFAASEWDQSCRILVPVPVDLSTLGLFAPEVEHRG